MFAPSRIALSAFQLSTVDPNGHHMNFPSIGQTNTGGVETAKKTLTAKPLLRDTSVRSISLNGKVALGKQPC